MILAPPSNSSEPTIASDVAVLDTTELRWFAEGSLSPDIESWFTRFHTVGTVEDRCDTYRIDGRRDTGVKHRFRETLELKVRQSIEEPLRLEPGLAGSLEAWRRWSPADGLADRSEHALAVDVCKRVIKRRFSVHGDEIATGPHVGSGCDVEVATVTVGNVDAWTFAFAAFGPDATRRTALLASWQALVADMPPPSGFAGSFGLSCGYPEWLDLLTVTGPLDTNTGQSEALTT